MFGQDQNPFDQFDATPATPPQGLRVGPALTPPKVREPTPQTPTQAATDVIDLELKKKQLAKGDTPEVAEQQALRRRSALDSIVGQINRTQELYEQRIRGGGIDRLSVGIGLPAVPTEENRQFESAAAGMAEQGLSAFRVPGVGSQSDAELRQFVEANKPTASDFDDAIEEKLRQLRARVDTERASLGLPPAQWTGKASQPTGFTDPTAVRTPTSRDDKAGADEEVTFGDEEKPPLGKRLSAAQRGAVEKALRAGDAGEAAALLTQFSGAPPGTPPTAETLANTRAVADYYRKHPNSPPAGVSYGRADAAARAAYDKERFGDHLESAIEGRKSTPGASVDAYVRGAANTASFGLANPFAASMDVAFGGRSFTDAMQRQRAIDEADRRVNPGAALAGTLTGAIMLPSRAGAVAATARTEALTGGAAVREAMQAGRNAGARQLGKEGGIYGTVYGTAENLDRPDRLSHGAVSGAIGTAGGYGAGQLFGAVANRFSANKGAAAADRMTPEAARGAQDLGIDVPGYVAGDIANQQSAATLAKSPFANRVMADAQSKFIEEGRAARDKIADDTGSALEEAAMGDRARGGLQLWRRASRANVGSLYRDAEARVGDSLVNPQHTIQEVGKLIREEGAAIGGTPAMDVLRPLAADLERGGAVTVDGARKTRSALRERLSETMAPSNADRITNRIMAAIARDIERDAPQAAEAFRIADKAHGERMAAIRDILEPFIGKDGKNWGDVVARNIMRDSKSNGERLEDMLKLLPRDAANDVRASLVSQLGRSTSGAQNAAGDAFSFDTFLTNWNTIKGARERIFTRETVRALNKLAAVAERAKATGRERNFSNTGTVTARDALMKPVTNALLGGTGIGVASGSTTAGLATAGAGVGIMLMRGLSQHMSAKALVSPKLVRRLANMPETPEAAMRFWKGPWVNNLARSEPTIAAELTGLRDFMVRSLAGGKVAAEDDDRPPLIQLADEPKTQE